MNGDDCPARIPPGSRFPNPAGRLVRRSSDFLTVEKPEVAKALSFIWQHDTERLGVADVVGATAMSRCTLSETLKHYVVRTIGEELERKRLEHASRPLLTTSEKVSRMALDGRFASRVQFRRALARVTGATRSAFRADTQAHTIETQCAWSGLRFPRGVLQFALGTPFWLPRSARRRIA